MFKAEVVCHSENQYGHQLLTFELRYPKFIHGELMTHRVFSRNASSSRAVPVRKLRQEAWDAELRAVPVMWGKNQKGMQAGESLIGWRLHGVRWLWGFAARTAVVSSMLMDKLGLHKQWANRILEPFTHINVVVTATEWDNFFGLRLHRDAQPEMRALALRMWGAKKLSIPRKLKPGEWHWPYVSFADQQEFLRSLKYDADPSRHNVTQAMTRVSVARCARVSFKSFETGKKSTVDEDYALYDRLLAAQPLHASPAEHQATPDEKKFNVVTDREEWQHQDEWGNFVGFRQFRKTLPGESKAPMPEGTI